MARITLFICLLAAVFACISANVMMPKKPSAPVKPMYGESKPAGPVKKPIEAPVHAPVMPVMPMKPAKEPKVKCVPEGPGKGRETRKKAQKAKKAKKH